MIGIYKITSPSNKIYIGQTINYEKRIKKYKSLECKKQTVLYRSFLKYGVENHQFEIIEECDIKELNEKERYYQDYYDVLNIGLNCKLTNTDDKSGKLSEETKLKISKGLKLSKRIYKSLSEESIQKMINTRNKNSLNKIYKRKIKNGLNTKFKKK
jgi:group I intron endonuclease